MKYAPADKKGRKPYVVEFTEWGRPKRRVVYAESLAEAKYQASGRVKYSYVTAARRATPEDVA
jgi:hypothetical protein